MQYRIDHKNTICAICGNNKTYIAPDGYPVWYRYKKDGIFWDRKLYCCSKCHSKKWNGFHCEAIKPLADIRNDLPKNTDFAKGLMIECVVCKVRNIDNFAIELDNFRLKYDTFPDKEYGIIQIKSSKLHRYYWQSSKIDLNSFDTLFFVCLDTYRKDIVRTYAIPRDKIIEYCSGDNITISNNYIRKGYDWSTYYKIDHTDYNDSYHDLISYFKDKKFNVENIKNWLKVKK